MVQKMNKGTKKNSIIVNFIHTYLNNKTENRLEQKHRATHFENYEDSFRNICSIVTIWRTYHVRFGTIVRIVATPQESSIQYRPQILHNNLYSLFKASYHQLEFYLTQRWWLCFLIIRNSDRKFQICSS